MMVNIIVNDGMDKIEYPFLAEKYDGKNLPASKAPAILNKIILNVQYKSRSIESIDQNLLLSDEKDLVIFLDIIDADSILGFQIKKKMSDLIKNNRKPWIKLVNGD
jgi:hypothetical protein